MFPNSVFSKTIASLATTLRNTTNFKKNIILGEVSARGYAKRSDDDCRRAIVDIPKEEDPTCPIPCAERRKKKEGILHKIKMRVTEGGTNFGTPFRRLKCDNKEKKKEKDEDKNDDKETKAVSTDVKSLASKKAIVPVPRSRNYKPGVQVSVLGADTQVGQYVALLLKQCSAIRKLRLYEAKDTENGRDLCQVAQDLQHINTNCRVQAFGCCECDLERCLQSSDIVLMLESGYVSMEMPLDKRFCYQAPMVKKYADMIAMECPTAFVIVCTSPIDCMVPLVAQTLKETSWYDPRKVLGSMAVPEMRASTLAARALCLEPRYTRVPCVGGSEGETLVPLFSKAVEFFSFTKRNAEMLTKALRQSPFVKGRSDEAIRKTTNLSEAHALAGLVTNVAHALLCNDTPRVTGFVETDASQVLSPARFMSVPVRLGNKGICKQFDFPSKISDYELNLLELGLDCLVNNVDLAYNWYNNNLANGDEYADQAMSKHFIFPKHNEHVQECRHNLSV